MADLLYWPRRAYHAVMLEYYQHALDSLEAKGQMHTQDYLQAFWLKLKHADQLREQER